MANLSIVPVTRTAIALLLATAPALPAQQAPAPAPAAAEVAELAAKALTEMEADRWDEALKLLARCVERHDAKALELYGPSFGVTWYRKGICELRLKRWDDAAKSFETCYRQYPNPGGLNGNEGNPYHKRALLRWGEAAQGAGRHEEAIRLFEKFMEERDKGRDTFDPGSFYLSLAICHFRLGQIPQGVEPFETALRNKPRFRTPDAGIVAAFEALVGAMVAKQEEQALLAFLERNRADLVIEPFEMEPFAGLFLKLAADALAAGMDGAALALAQLVPSSDVMTADLKSRLARLGTRNDVKELTRTVDKAKLQASLDRLARQRAAGEPNEVILLGLTAVIHEKRGNLRGAFAAYQQLEQFFSKAAKREDHLYHAVRTAAAIGEAATVAEQGERFLKDFPTSKHAPAVSRLLLGSLFQAGDFEACVRVATGLLAKLGEGSPEHDLALHVLGASQYHLGKNPEARALLERHLALYPKSPYGEAARYFQASNLVRLEQWPEAAAALDRFLQASTGPYLPFVLHERATCHLAQGESAAAMEKLARLEQDFPEAEVLDAGLVMRGNLLAGAGKDSDAVASYKKALDLATRRSHAPIAAEALYRLVAVPAANPAALSHAERFWKDHATSPLRLRMATAQLAAYAAAGREEEALGRLREAITAAAGAPETEGLQEAIDRYASAYLAKHDLAKLEEHLRHFPGSDPANPSFRARLLAAVIAAAEKRQSSVAGERVKALFQELKSQFSPPQLPGPILLRTGDFLRAKTSAPRQALPYYDEALARPDPSLHTAARFGSAMVLATGSAEDKARAIDAFKQVFAETEDPALKEQAFVRLAETQLAAGRHPDAIETARQYLAPNSGFTGFVSDASLILAKALEAHGRVDEALAAYRDVWTHHQDVVRVSAPAMGAWLELSAKRVARGESSREVVHEAGMNYLVRTRPAFATWSDGEKAAWQEIEKRVKEFAPAVDVKPAGKEDKP